MICFQGSGGPAGLDGMAGRPGAAVSISQQVISRPIIRMAWKTIAMLDSLVVWGQNPNFNSHNSIIISALIVPLGFEGWGAITQMP